MSRRPHREMPVGTDLDDIFAQMRIMNALLAAHLLYEHGYSAIPGIVASDVPDDVVASLVRAIMSAHPDSVVREVYEKIQAAGGDDKEPGL